MTGRIPLLTTAEGRNDASFGAIEWALFGAISLVWGASFLFIDIALDEMEPGVIAFLRVVLGAVTLLVLPIDKGHIARADWVRIAVLAVIWLAVPMTLFPLAQQYINSSITGMLNAALPSLTAFVASLLLRRFPGQWQVAGIAVGFVGIVLISVPTLGEGDSAWIGVAAVFTATLLYAFSANIVTPLQQTYGSIPVLTRVLGLAVPMTAPLALVGIGDSGISWPAALSMLALGIVGTGMAFVAYGSLIGRAGATRASGVTYVIPVVAVVLGVQLRGDDIGALAGIGCALVVLGTAFNSRGGR